jgi:hypothetical protein
VTAQDDRKEDLPPANAAPFDDELEDDDSRVRAVKYFKI